MLFILMVITFDITALERIIFDYFKIIKKIYILIRLTWFAWHRMRIIWTRTNVTKGTSKAQMTASTIVIATEIPSCKRNVVYSYNLSKSLHIEHFLAS